MAPHPYYVDQTQAYAPQYSIDYRDIEVASNSPSNSPSLSPAQVQHYRVYEQQMVPDPGSGGYHHHSRRMEPHPQADYYLPQVPGALVSNGESAAQWYQAAPAHQPHRPAEYPHPAYDYSGYTNAQGHTYRAAESEVGSQSKTH